MRARISPLNLAIVVATQALTFSSAHAASADDLAKGKQIFARCAVCHAIAPNAPRKLGPSLAGVVGRKAGSVADFNYSKAMRATKLTWTAANIEKFLQNPQALVPGTTMVAPPIATPADRSALIAYLRKPIP